MPPFPFLAKFSNIFNFFIPVDRSEVLTPNIKMEYRYVFLCRSEMMRKIFQLSQSLVDLPIEADGLYALRSVENKRQCRVDVYALTRIHFGP